MSVTITIMLGFWLASSYIEYRAIKACENISWLHFVRPLFDNPWGGIVISVLIGMAVGAIMGPANGVGAALGQLLGLATNKFTYNMYDTGRKANEFGKTQYNSAKNFCADNKDSIATAANTVRLGAKGLGLLFLAVMFVIGLPFRAAEAYKASRYSQ